MITLGEYVGGPIEFGFSQKEYDRITAIWKGVHHFERLDSITTSTDELDRLVDVLREMKDASSDLVLHAGLPEFELVVTEPIPSMNMTVIRYKKTALVGKTFTQVGSDGSKLVYKPAIDMYVSFQQSKRVDVISTIYVVEATGAKAFTGTSNAIQWRNSDSPWYERISNTSDQAAQELFRDIRLIYIAIQRAFKYKPEVFHVAGIKKSEPVAPGTHKKKSYKTRVRFVKMICINQEVTKRYAQPVKHMSCPCWGVIGHMRTYKSGKQVWIAPYRKGKERNNPGAYRPKEYVMEE